MFISSYEYEDDHSTVYLVKHIYDVDGGFGDSVSTEETIGYTTNKIEALEFVEKYSNPHIYDKPYAALHCGELVITTIGKLDMEKDPISGFNRSTLGHFDEDDDEDDED